MENLAYPLVIIIIIALAVAVAFMFRKVYLWYTGMMELLTELMKQTRLLTDILEELKKNK